MSKVSLPDRWTIEPSHQVYDIAEVNQSMENVIVPRTGPGVDRDLKVDLAVSELNRINMGQPARRLQSLNEALSSDVQMGKLSNINIYGAFDPEAIEKRAADEALREYSTLWSGFEWIRNVLVLVPITLTWFSFWLAAQDYGALLQSDPQMRGESFLYLWETGFAGKAVMPFMTFSQTALLAAFVLVIIIFLTILVHYRKDVGATRANNDAAKIRADVEDALWEIEKALSSRRRTDTDIGVVEDLQQALLQFNTISAQMGSAVSQMDGGAREWMNLTKGLDLRLGMVVGQMKEEADGLRVFSNGLTGNVDKMFSNLESASQTSARLATAIEQLSGAVQANTVVQEDKLTDIAAQLNLMEEEAKGWGLALRKTTDDLRLAVDKSSSSAASIAGAVVTVTAVLKGQDELRAAINSLERTLSTTVASSRDEAGALGASQLRSTVEGLARTNAEIARDQTNLLTQIRNELTQTMRAFMTERASVTQALEQQALNRNTGPVQAQIQVMPLAFAIGASVVVASILVIGAVFLMLRVFPN